MATQKENKHSFASIIVVIVLLGSLASLALIPLKTFEFVRSQEQTQIKRWLGDETDQWIMSNIVDLLQWINTEGAKSVEDVHIGTNSKINSWIMQRVYVALIWGHVVLYRCGLLAIWMFFGVPLLAAAIMDGHYQREIRKATFISQSPVLHKSGIDLAKFSVAMIVCWIFIPYHITMMVAPLGISLTGAAAWIWLANMQKRM